MTKISNQYSLTNILTADLANSRLGINNVSPTVALDVTGAGRISSSLGVGAAAAYASTTLLVRSNSSTSTNWAFIAEDNATNQIFGIRNNGNVGIGTGSPTAKLEIASSSFQDHLILNRTGIGLMHITATNPRGLAITDGTTQFLTIAQSTGNVGIGTTSPAYKLHISGVAANNIFNMTDTTGYVIHQLSNTSGSFYYAIDNSAGGAIGNGAYVRHIYSNGAYPIVITTNDVERMRITSDAKVLMGTTTYGGVGNSFDNGGGIIVNYSGVGFRTCVEFKNGNGTIGSITSTGSVTSYNTSSDYRLKEDLKDYNGLNIISKLKTYDFKWKDASIRDYGMMAHELQEVLPNYVNGVKDAINEDGRINPQAVDYSKLVPVLVKAIQELSAKVSLLENK